MTEQAIYAVTWSDQDTQEIFSVHRTEEGATANIEKCLEMLGIDEPDEEFQVWIEPMVLLD